MLIGEILSLFLWGFVEEIILIFNDIDIKCIKYNSKFYINILDLIKSFEGKKFVLQRKIKNIYYLIKLKMYKINTYCKIEDVFKALILIYNKKNNIELVRSKLLKLLDEQMINASNECVDSIILNDIKLDIIKSLFK